jgi:hypothetical protein
VVAVARDVEQVGHVVPGGDHQRVAAESQERVLICSRVPQ